MDSFDFYRLYNSLNLHFKEGSKFDFFKYQGFSRATPESFAARKDKYFFEKNSKYFSNGEEAVAFIAGNFIAGNTHITKFSKEAYLETWSKPKDSLVYNYERTLRKYIEDGNGLTQLLEQN